MKCSSTRLQCLFLFGVNNYNIRENFWEFLGVEDLRSFLLVISVVHIEYFSVTLKYLLEFTNVSWHVHGRWVYEYHGLSWISLFELSLELWEIRIEHKLYRIRSCEELIEISISKFLCLESFVFRYQSFKLFWFNIFLI